jgi:hypothetical protein
MTQCARYLAILTILFHAFLGAWLPAWSAPSEKSPQTAPGVVEELYDLVTFEAGTTPDWDRVRSLFADEAVVVLRTGREEMTIFSLDGFVNDFVQFIEQSEVEKTGFTERILKMKSTGFGDIAHVLVLFDSHIDGSENPPRQGIDSFQLIREAGAWKIISITNDRPSPGNPIPMSLFD